MTKPTLVILAAGMASRYGSMKQVEAFGPSGETIMDYSIYDAIRSGFGKIVFVIRKEYERDFRSAFDSKTKGLCETAYVFQELDSFTENFSYPKERTKPWGTAHAVLCAREVVKENFAVINADDFYGRDAFERAAAFLGKECNAKTYGIVVYELMKTLSEYGKVNRGVCELNKAGNLSGITERINIGWKDDRILCDDGLEPHALPVDTKVSMNFWCFSPFYFDHTMKLFGEFLRENSQELKSEFFIPIVADRFIQEGGEIKTIPTTASWFGVTYKEDAPMVRENLNSLIRQGEYPEKLWKS